MGSKDAWGFNGNKSFIVSSSPHFPGYPTLLLAWTLDLDVPQTLQ